MADPSTRLPWPVPADLTPRQITAALHAEIAARSPGHAALVAAFETLPRTPEHLPAEPRQPVRGSRPRLRRQVVYNALRLGGASEKTAARKAGVGHASRWQYETDFLGVMGGAVPWL